MADNTIIEGVVTPGESVRTEDKGGNKTQVMLLDIGGAGAEVLLDGSHPLPITGALTDTQLRAAAVPVSGPLTDAQLRATALPVSGTFFQATQPVSGPLTDTQLRASAVPVSGTFFQATQPVSAASLPLPTGAATEATLSSANTALGAAADAEAAGNGSLIAILKRIRTLLGGTLTVALAAGTNLIGAVASALRTDAIFNGTTSLTPKFAVISASASGPNTVVALASGKKIRVLRYSCSANGAVNVKWQSSAAGDITGLKYLTQFVAHAGSFCPVGLFETAAGEALVLNLSAAIAVGGELTYVEV